MTIPEIFDKHGEPYFRAGEARVIAACSITARRCGDRRRRRHGPEHARPHPHQRHFGWLKADLDVLMKRTKRRNDRPLAEKIKDCCRAREPLYAMADSPCSRATSRTHHRRRDHRRDPEASRGG